MTEEKNEAQNEQEEAQETAADEATEASEQEAAAEAQKEEAEEKEEASEDKGGDASDDDEEVEVPEEFKAFVEQIENMTVLQLHELVKVLEKKFGVSAAAVAVAGAGAAGGDGAEEKDEFEVVLSAIGDKKIAVIKAVKEILGLGLKEAKEMVEGAPATVKAGVKKEEAEEMKAKLEEAGATVELK